MNAADKYFDCGRHGIPPGYGRFTGAPNTPLGNMKRAPRKPFAWAFMKAFRARDAVESKEWERKIPGKKAREVEVNGVKEDNTLKAFYVKKT